MFNYFNVKDMPNTKYQDERGKKDDAYELDYYTTDTNKNDITDIKNEVNNVKIKLYSVSRCSLIAIIGLFLLIGIILLLQLLTFIKIPNVTDQPSGPSSTTEPSSEAPVVGELVILQECAGNLSSEPFNIAMDEMLLLEEQVAERTRQKLTLRESMYKEGSGEKVMKNLADEAGPFLVIAITEEGYIVGGFSTAKWFERKRTENMVGNGYGYDRDDHAFTFGLNTPSGRQPIFLAIRDEHKAKAVYRGPDIGIIFGNGDSYKRDLELRFTSSPPTAGASTRWYGPVGTNRNILLGDARGWSETLNVVDWHVFGRPV